ncbi:MAG TPA: L-seryl-tRNA(Sec) selenium transferase [Alphaproteobacteria bacterium]|nr:L-seryl-tRNA(Sec) selenium transferase [Alphaproteobacteria bacterium]
MARARPNPAQNAYAALPAVSRMLAWPAVRSLAAAHGAAATLEAVRAALDDARDAIAAGTDAQGLAGETALAADVAARLEALFAPPLKRVFNLTGTVIHTNLGRAPLAAEAIAEIAATAAGPVNLEFDLASGRRGDRDDLLEEQICRLTGAEAATVVNNNAAAILLMLNTLARRKEVVVSRGELVEIGGAFRIPDVMARAGAKLHEVGTTNRTHLKDYDSAISDKTACIMKVHTSNYEVRGFTKSVPEADLAALARAHGLPFVVDLGSGMLIDLEDFGLPHERTARETLGKGGAGGADLVTFSGDKLLGGPQAGIIAGRAELVAKIKRNPMKRALRLDKLVIAALSATLRLYEDPGRLAERLPVLRLLTMPADEIAARAKRLCPALAKALDGAATVEAVPCKSQIGSGALPVDLLPSTALAIRPAGEKRRGGKTAALAAAFRDLPMPVIGRVSDGALLLDLRCLEDEAAFVEQLGRLDLSGLTAPAKP